MVQSLSLHGYNYEINETVFIKEEEGGRIIKFCSTGCTWRRTRAYAQTGKKKIEFSLVIDWNQEENILLK